MHTNSPVLFKSLAKLTFGVAALSASEHAWGQSADQSAGELRSAPGPLVEQLPSVAKISPKLSALLEVIKRNQAAPSGVYLNPAHRLSRVAASKDLSEVMPSVSNQSWMGQGAVIERLGLTTEQKQQVDLLQERSQKLLQDWSDLIMVELPQLQASQRDIPTATRRFDTEQFIVEKRVDLFELRSAEIRTEIAQILSARQLRILSQYENRGMLLQYGADQGFRKALGAELALSQADNERVKTACGIVSKEVIARTQVLAQRQFKETLQCLTVEQVEQLQSLLGDWKELIQPLPELLVFQLRQVERSEAQALDTVAEWRRYEREWAPNSVGELEELRELFPASPAALLLVATTPVYGKVTQWGTVPTEEALKKFNDLLSPSTRDSALGRLAKEELRRDLTTVLEPLTQEQRGELEVVLLRRLVALRGIDTTLLKGNLGRKLALTESQRERIATLATQHIEESTRESYALEQEVWDAILQELSPQQSERIREQYVGSLEGSAGAPVLLLMALTAPAGVERK
jgi:hypothetical protein